MNGEPTTGDVLAALAELHAEVRALRQVFTVPQHAPAEVNVEQAMVITNHKSRRAFHTWCKAHRVRPISRGRYAVRRLEAALAAK